MCAVNKTWGYSHLVFSSLNQNLGLVEGLRDANTGEFLIFAESPLERIATENDFESRTPVTPYQNVRHYKMLTDNSFNLGRSRLKINIGYQNNLRKEFADPENPNEPELFFDLKTLSYNFQFALPTKSEWQTTFGLGGMRQSNENKGDETLIPEYNLFDIGVFGFIQKYYGKTTVSGGLRYDYRLIDSKEGLEGTTVKFEPFQRKFYNFSASAGVSYHPASFLTLKGNISRGFRAPTLTELSSNGAHEGTVRFEYGNRDLIVKADDIGVHLAQDRYHPYLQKFGRGIVKFMPHFLNFLGVVGTAAMLWVGAEIIAHGISLTNHLLHDLQHALAHIPVVAWFAKAIACGIGGLIIGFIIEKIVLLVKKVLPKKK